jgi:hypothetical protein
MLTTDCVNCGNPVSAFAGACKHCGVTNRTRLGALAVAGSLLFLIVAVGIATLAVVRWQRVLVAPTDDLGWLTTAMDECDAVAAKTPDTLHFLVIPTATVSADVERWRSASLNDIGNGILLTKADMFDGLKEGVLRISTEQYEFKMRNEATGAAFTWSPSVGVKKFLVPNAARIEKFKIQFKTRRKTDDAEWGATFFHKSGTCYWVNAIIGELETRP